MNKSDLILLAARPGMGKTSMALNMAMNVAKTEQKTVAIFSLEMSREQLVTRILSTEARVESGRLAVIPTPGLDELLCWELHCTAADGQEVLSYVNTETGLEEQLYILQRDEHGTLAN